MGKKFDFDIIVIGSGPAGSAAALTLAKAKKRVAVIEGGAWGGTDFCTRKIPYAASRQFAKLVTEIRRGGKFGLSALNLHFNLPTAIAWQRAVVKNASDGCKKKFEEAKVTCIDGYANFLDVHTVAVGDKKYTANEFILATGAKASTIEIAGAERVMHLTPETALRLRRVPKAVLVVGGGKSGCETAEYFAELGSKVLIMEASERLLPREDAEVGATIADYFANNLGMMVLLNTRVVALEEDTNGRRVVFMSKKGEKAVRIDTIVLATGAKAVTDYGLENVGVKYRKSGIVVDKTLKTTAKNIYAVGRAIDVRVTDEKAAYQGTFLANSLVTKSKNLLDYHGFMRVVNTYPEVAIVGLTEDELTRRGRKYRKAIVYLGDTVASKVKEFEKGFVKIIVDSNNKIIGATVVAPEASLIIQELAVAVRHHLSALEIASTPHVMDSFAEAVKLAARKLVKK